ncbi:MAG: ATP-binding protein [Pseudomonadota bacterium]
MNSIANLRMNFKDTLLPLVLFTLFFFGNGILGYFSIRSVANDQELVNISLRNINLIHELLVEVLRAESGQRGYLLTNMDAYAEPYYEAMQNIDGKITNLGGTELDAEQSNRFYEIQLLVTQKLEELKENFELLRDANQLEALRGLMSHRGLALMFDINEIASMMEQHESDLLDARMLTAEQGRISAFFLILTSNLVGLLLVFVSMMLVRTGLKKEQQFLANLQEAKDDLELKVEERTYALQHFSNELKRSNRELQDFAFVASHDLQEPLRKIRAFGDRLQQSYAAALGEQGADYIERMQKASARMSRLIEDLLSFSRITTKAKPFLPVSLGKVAEEVIEDLEVAIQESGAVIHVDDLPEIQADLFQMKQLFQNLLSNAIKFRKADVAPHISITIAAGGDTPSASGADLITLLFADNGIGFDEVFLDRIFLPFQRLHGKSEYGGTGIGLAICRRVAERHGGSLTATSKVGEGSTFIVTLSRENQVFDVEESINEN